MNKKIFVLIAVVYFVSPAFAQDAGSKKFRFGLKGVPSMNWYRTEDNAVKKNGTGLGLGWGLITEFGLTDNVALATGLQFDNDRGKLRYESGDLTNYSFSGANYIYIDPNLTLLKNIDKDTAGKTFETFKLEEREYYVKYITLPVVLKMKTKEIGHLTYFGQFGFIVSFKTKAFADDKGKRYNAGAFSTNDTTTSYLVINGKQYNTTPPSTSYEKTKIDVSSDVSLFRVQLSVGGGVEWNLAGSTSLLFGLNYNRGFSNVLAGGFSSNSDHLFMVDKNNKVLPFSQKAFADNVALTVGILF